jgi:tetratricopeptide (TPR) repeat protein
MFAAYFSCLIGKTSGLISSNSTDTKVRQAVYLYSCVALSFFLIQMSPCVADNNKLDSMPGIDALLSDPKIFLELPKESFYNIDPSDLTKLCNDLLKKEKSLDKKLVAKLYCARAIAFRRNKKYQLAVSDYDNALKNDPDNYLIRCDRDFCLMARGDKTAALEDIYSLLKIDPKCSPAHVLASLIYLMDGNTKESLRHANMAIEVDKKNADAYYLRAFALVASKSTLDHHATLDHDTMNQISMDINRCIAIAPMSMNSGIIQKSAPYELRGAIRALQLNFSSALEDFYIAKHLNPTSPISPTVLQGLSGAYYGMKKYRLSRYYAEQYVKLYPKDTEAHQALAAALAKLNDFDSAMNIALKVLKLNEKDYRSHFQVAAIAALSKNYELAIKHYVLSHDLAPDKTDPVECLVILLSCCPDPKYRNEKKALQLAKTLCANEKSCHSSSLMCLAIAYAANGLFDSAIDSIKKAIDRADTERRAYADLKEADLNTYDAGLKDFKDACTQQLVLFQQRKTSQLTGYLRHVFRLLPP